ncbi:MAG: ubiquitin-like small modifier protein 1 [Acidobacteriota bacterium]
MPVLFRIPGQLRELAGDRSEIRVESAASLSDALAHLWTSCPAIRDRVVNELGEVRPHVNIFVNGECIRDAAGLTTSVSDGSEIFILPAISGG